MQSSKSFQTSPSQRLLFPSLVLLLVLFSPLQSFAISDTLVGSFVDDGIRSLSRGGLEPLPRRQEALDFTSPLFLNSDGSFLVETSNENQRTLRIYGGRWDGTHAYSDRLETSAAAPFTLLGGKLKGSASVGYGKRSQDISARNIKEDLYIKEHENVEAPKGGLYLEGLDLFRIGIAVISINVRDGLEVPVEAEIAPLSFLKIGYKHSYLDDFVYNFDVTLSGHFGNLPLKDLEEINEGYAVLEWQKIIFLKYANELAKTGNRRIEGRLNLPASVYLVGNYAKRELPTVDEAFTVDGNRGGNFKGDFRHSEYRVGIGAAWGGKWTVEANYRHGDFDTHGGGVALSNAVAGFWPSLLLGNYNYLYRAGLSSDQYHLGTEYQGDRFSFGFGFQYLDIRPQGTLDYWRSVLFGVGRTGAGSVKLTIDRVEMIFLSFGVGYRWRNVSIKYAFGQFIPIATHDTDEKLSQPAAGGSNVAGGGGSGGGGSDFFSSLADKITHNPGGNLQRLMLTLTF